MRNRVLKKVFRFVTGIGAVGAMLIGRSIALASPLKEGADAARGKGMPADLFGENGTFTQITNTILVVIGIVSVFMLIYGGLRYILSGGDSKKVVDAKNTVMYAIIGLIIVFLSYALVNFVIEKLEG
ncbi:MAG: pilin [Candidatus Nomurabacteria bacterium]|jgi:cytochrome bd-type quinol oxidase subunit 2|nr:pilin [Candidatus Nomurabacteria bacterium]